MIRLFTINNRICTASNIALYLSVYDPYNPLDLPPNTVRVRTYDRQPPSKSIATYETATFVPGTLDVYDVYKSGTDFTSLLRNTSVTEVLGANTTGITNMNFMFDQCFKLTSVPLFDTSSVTSMNHMFSTCSLATVPLFDTSNVTTMIEMFFNCESLTALPLFDTSNVTNMQGTFYNCKNVQTGALALYQQASSQANPPSNHFFTFANCGINTTLGAAELAQIPNDWKGS